MILITCGSSHLPFDRLVGSIDALGDREDIVVQHGPSRLRPEHAESVDFVPLDRLTDLVRQARVVVTHAGVGSILMALTNGKRPVVVPRRAEHGEAVDDHQLECARRFARADLVTLVEDPAQLAGAIAEAEVAMSPRLDGDLPLVSELRTFVQAAVSR
jgi:beta-1,4-N-acetylglucosaminyltransferase